MIDGYFINPEGNLGHPVAYTHTQIHLCTYTPHRHTYINHIYIHIGRTYIHTHRENIFTQSVSRYRPYCTECNDCDSVGVQEESVLVLLVWIVKKNMVILCLCGWIVQDSVLVLVCVWKVQRAKR